MKKDIKSENKTVKAVLDDVKKDEKKAAKIAKAINNKTEKAVHATNALEVAKAKKELILLNANAQADRIINAAIKREEEATEWATRYEALKKDADAKRKAKALFKREAKEKVKVSLWRMQKSMPKVTTKEVAKRQAELENIHASKIETKKIAKYARLGVEELTKLLVDPDYKEDAVFIGKALEIANIRAARREANKTKALNKLHHKDKEIAQPKEETKRIKAMTPEERKAEYRRAKAEAEARFKASGVVPNSNQKKKDENKEKSLARMQQLAEIRLKRMEKKQAVELTAKQKRDADIARFLKSEQARKARKTAKQETYLTKGAKPKVKTKKVVDVSTKKPLSLPKEKEELVKYLIATQTIGNIDSAGAFTCRPSDLKKRVKEAHDLHMDPKTGNPDTYVGIFVKDPKDPNKYILEMVNDKFRNIDGVLTSRLEQNKAAIAA